MSRKLPAGRQVKLRDWILLSRLTQVLKEGSQVIIQFSTKLTSEGNSQNQGRIVLKNLSRGEYSQAAGRQKFSYPILSDLLNYTLNLSFVNIAFSLHSSAPNRDKCN